jgi:hypothetical protein
MNQRVLEPLPVEQETTIREMYQNHFSVCVNLKRARLIT